jgi:hypothetical protein
VGEKVPQLRALQIRAVGTDMSNCLPAVVTMINRFITSLVSIDVAITLAQPDMELQQLLGTLALLSKHGLIKNVALRLHGSSPLSGVSETLWSWNGDEYVRGVASAFPIDQWWVAA